MNTLTKCILILSASIAPLDTVFSATITGDGVIITPNIGIDATIDFRSNGTASSPGLTLSFLDAANPSEFAAVSKIHRQHGLWQWQSLDGNNAEQLLLQLGNWGANDTPHLILMDAASEPSFLVDAGDQSDGRPAVLKLMTPTGTGGVASGVTAGIELNAGKGPGQAAPTLTFRNSSSGLASVIIDGGNSESDNAGSIKINGNSVLTKFQNSDSFAFGVDVEPTGLHAAAFGDATYAHGRQSVTFGQLSIASGSNSAAFGYFSQAGGDHSAAFGEGSVANGLASAAFNQSMATGMHGAAFNYGSSSGWASVAFNNSTATGDYSAAFGNSTLAGPEAASFGWSTQATGGASATFGLGTKAQGYGQFVIGSLNVPQGSPFDWIETDDLFIVGNGNGNYSNAMTVKKNGNATFSASLAAGPGSITTGTAQTVVGVYNDTNTNDAGTNHTSGVFIVGAGTNSGNRKNALRVRSDSVILIQPSGDIDMGEFTAGDKP
jgi:hypothetical protein